MKIAFFETKEWEETYLKERLQSFDTIFYHKPLDEETLPAENDYEIISVFTSSKITKGVIKHFPQLKLISTRSTGIEHIDQPELKDRQIQLVNVPYYGSRTVAEYTFALLLNYSRKISTSIRLVKEKSNFSSDGLQGFDLIDKTLGVIGTGSIGREVIKLAKAFGMTVIAFDAKEDEESSKNLGFQYVSFNDLLQNSDIITLHVPYLESTHHIINEENIYSIKKGSILINTARGALIETKALIKALEEKILSGALLDVLEEENDLKNKPSNLTEATTKTLKENQKLIGMENVFITPHNAFNTKEALSRILETTIKSIRDFSGN